MNGTHAAAKITNSGPKHSLQQFGNVLGSVDKRHILWLTSL